MDPVVSNIFLPVLKATSGGKSFVVSYDRKSVSNNWKEEMYPIGLENISYLEV